MTYNTETLIGTVNALERFEPFILGMFFPSEITFDTEEIDFDQIADDLRLAPFVSPVKSGRIMRDRGFDTKKFKPAYVKPKHEVNPARLLKRRAGEAIGGALATGQRRNAIITENLRIEDNAISMREEWMACQALTTGKVIVEGEDYPAQEVDFYRDPNLTKTLVGAAQWSDPASTPIKDLSTWAAETSAPFASLVFGQDAWLAFETHDDVKKALDINIRGTTSTLAINTPDGKWYVLKGFIGNIACWVYTAVYTDDAANKQLYIPSNTIIAGSPAVDGYRCYGAIMDGSADYRALRRFPKHWIQQDDPFREMTMTQAAPLMVPARPDASMSAQVVD